MLRFPLLASGLVALAVAAAVPACSSGDPARPTAGPAFGLYVPNTPAVYVPKVKNLLTGLAATDDEVQQVTKDPSRLGDLVDAWMATPQYEAKMRRFFELAFQQTQIAIPDFADQVFPRLVDVNSTTAPLLLQNAEESFARTAMELEREGRPFTETMTTTRFMMTPALMELYAFLDAYHVDDAGVVTDRFAQSHPGVTITVEASEGPIPIAQTLDPAGARYMRWYDPDVAKSPTAGPGCGGDPITYAPSAIALHQLLYGALDFRKAPDGRTTCGQYGGTKSAPQLTSSDFTSWKMVTVRRPLPIESPTAFYDLPNLRATDELVLSIPRVGFFSTPAFFANWPTNTSNQMRVTTNQALIVALGKFVDRGDPTTIATTPGLDTTHAVGACAECHARLDPTRSILAATYSWNYHEQSDPRLLAQAGQFQFDGVVAPVADVTDFGAILARHPSMPAAWLQKLCFYASSAACDASQPEFAEILGAFASSHWSWRALVRAFVTSKLALDSQVISVSRRDHLCAALEARLGLADVCGLDATSGASKKGTVPQIVRGLPSDGYGRGAAQPVLPNQPTLFYRAAVENMCAAIAPALVDVPDDRRAPGVVAWSSGDPDGAIADFVRLVMDVVPSDPRSTASRRILRAHFDAALAVPGVTPTSALESTFVASCLAPSAMAVGL